MRAALLIACLIAGCDARPEPEPPPAPPIVEGPRIDVRSLRIEPSEHEGLMLVRVDGHLEALPSLAGAWEADLAVACELAHVGATAGWRWQALVPLEGEEAGAFSIARDVERAEYRFCEVTGRVRHACALEDMRRNRCDRAGSLELAPACLVPDGEGAWRAAAASACTPFYSRH